MKIVADWTNKNIHFVYNASMAPLGYVECVSPTDWKIFNAEGKFLDWETNKRRAAKFLAA